MRLASYLVFPVFLFVFFEQALERSRVARVLWMVQLAVAVVVLALDLAGRASMFSLSPFTDMLFAVAILIMMAEGIRKSIRGNQDARVLMIGITVLGVTGLNDILTGIGVIPYWHWISPIGSFFFILALVYLADRRFEGRALLLKEYSRQLEEKSAQLEEYASTLEEKVTERTRNLHEKNRVLGDTLSQLRDTQQQLVMREKMASLGNLVAGVAHEVNNPVGAINSAADAARRCIVILDENARAHGDGEARVRKALDILSENNTIISTASERVTNIVRSLRNFSRLDEAEYQKANLHEGIDSTLTLVHHKLKNRIDVVREYGADVPAIECFPNQLNQVFMNILVNAAQAIEDEGTITIRTTRDGDFVVVAISDTGKGIRPEHMERLFDPGFTTKGVGVGTGLGLSITYKIVEQHGGTIDVESEVGRGTTFSIRLPISAAEHTPVQSP
jgi:signal transduction histidine kinase